MKISILFIIASLLVGTTTFADTLDVCLSGCRFNSIQAAIDSAVNGDLIRVDRGPYVGTLTVRKNISLMGGYFGPPTWRRNINLYETILDGDSLGSVVTISGNFSPLIDGFTITGGYGTNGGGVAISSSSPTLSHNTIKGNRAISYGGGVWIIGRSAAPRLDANRIIENIAFDGGGVFINDYSSPCLTNNVIEKNGAISNGDGIYIDFYSTPKIINNVIIENNLPVIGRRTSPEGIFLYNFPSPTILNNIIANHVGGFGINADRVFVLDSISTIDYNNVWGNNTNYSDVPCGEHDISDDPRFVNPNNGDYHVQPNSIVIDKGTSQDAPETDIDDDLRPLGNGIDIGIDEDTLNIAQPPEIPSLVSPPNGLTEAPRYQTLYWNASSGSGPILYRMQISRDSCFSSSTNVLEQRGIKDTMRVLGFNLLRNAKYYWRVDASNQLGTSAWSDIWNFTTTIAAGTPWLISPVNGAIEQPTTLTLRWNYDFNATYRLQVSKDSSFNMPVFDDTSVAIRSQQVGPLANNTTYCWRVQAKDNFGSGWGPWSGVWSFTTTCLRNGDVNNDSTLTPGDALCAFQIFLNGNTLPENCNTPKAECEVLAADANCDSSVTPGDALAIFQRFLQNLPPKECFARNTLAANLGGKSYHLTWDKRWLFSEEIGEQQAVKLILRIDDPQNLSTFGFNLSYPKDKLKFLGIKRGSLTSDWTQLDARESSAGMITLGGFHSTSIQRTEAGELLELLFAGTTQSLRAGDFAATNFSDDFSEVHATHFAMADLANVPKEFELFQNSPNPLSKNTGSQETLIRFQLPGSAMFKVDLVIYNMMGQLVRRLISGDREPGSYEIPWDGRDEAGHLAPTGLYFYRLQAGNFVKALKLTIVR